MIFHLCGSWICAWILILYLVIWWHLWLKETAIRSKGIWYMLLFIYPKIVYVFFLFFLLPLSPFFLCSSHFCHFLAFFLLPFCFHSAISLLIVFSSLSCLILLSLPPVPFISYTTTRLVSLPEYLQFKCHQSCFSPCCLWSSFSLHTDDEASNRKIS